MAQGAMAHTPETQQDYYAFAEGEEEDEDGGQFSSFEYGYSEDNPLLEGDPTHDEHVYITEEEYDAINEELKDILEGRSDDESVQPSYQDIYMRLMQLEENREWSICEDIVAETEPGSDQGLRIGIDSEGYTELKEMLGGAYQAAIYLADYIINEYGEKIADDRTMEGIIAEIYIHDFLNTMISDDFDYSAISNPRMVEAIKEWKITARELNVVYDGDANRQRGEILADILRLSLDNNMDESILMNAALLYMLDDYRARYGIGALTDFFN